MDKLDIKKRRVMMYFIEATQDLILNEGIENLSIKKIADKAGYNTATIYNYIFQRIKYEKFQVFQKNDEQTPYKLFCIFL